MLAGGDDIEEMEGALAQSASSNARPSSNGLASGRPAKLARGARDDPLEDQLNQKLAQINRGGKSSGAHAQSTYAALLKDLNLSDELAGASLGGAKGADAHAQAVIQARQARHAQQQSLKALKSMHFNIDSESQPAAAAPVGYAPAAQRPVQALGSVAPFEYAPGADTSSPMQFGGDNVVGSAVVNSALSTATSNSFGALHPETNTLIYIHVYAYI